MRKRVSIGMVIVAACCCAAENSRLPVRVTWGHSRPAASYFVDLQADRGMTIAALHGYQLEPGETAKSSYAGGGDVDGVEFVLDCPARIHPKLQNMQLIWADVIAGADADTARRLGNDAAVDPQSPRLNIRTSEDGTRGFAVTLTQLEHERAIWVPAYDIYITAGEPFVEYASHRKELERWHGQSVRDRIAKEPEASYEQYAARWEDMGSPLYVNPQQTGNGHVIGVAWDSSIHKFGIDRGAGVRNDLGNPDRFHFWFDFGDLSKGIGRWWKGQSLLDGLPVVTTIFERDQVRYEVEQFAYPLDGPSAERRGDLQMVMMQRVRMSAVDGVARRITVTMSQSRALDPGLRTELDVKQGSGVIVAKNSSFGQVLFEMTGGDGEAVWSGVHDYDNSGMKRLNVTVPVDLPAKGARELVVKLPSPMLDAEGAEKLRRLDYATARAGTIRFWTEWVERGAQFRVPEKVVNDLFRASLWHALRLPRRHGDAIDLPYSNFAYDQVGTPWPVNQAVYVDYMLYGLRGYHKVADEEIRAQYRANQESNGHVSGFANWMVYTPGMLYAAAWDYTLSGDRAAFDAMLPQNLKALAWCLDQVRDAEQRDGAARGLVSGPLNDLTGDGVWAFNQAYMYAGLESFGRVLEQFGDPHAAEARAAAARLSASVERGFRIASARSPLVQLRDHTWVPFVPGEAGTYRRSLEVWYPTDVDTGPMHLVRLKTIPAHSDMADWLLDDHEDNLFFNGWGLANEPVYNQHATAYLLRDDPKAVIRTFYSYMAGAFSQSALEPVEHRFTHGQYFGPPSTDGAWFELYRNMLVRETDNGGLLLAGFTPRRWLRDSERIEVSRAPTAYGAVSVSIRSASAGGKIEAEVQMPDRTRPKQLLVRLRHPDGARLRSVEVNGRAWTDFDAAKEWVRISSPAEARYTIVARY